MTFELMAEQAFPLAPRQQLLAHLARGLKISACHVEKTEPLERSPTLIGLACRLAELAHTLVGLLKLLGGEPFGGREHRAQNHQHVEFALIAFRAVRKRRGVIACLEQMLDRLDVRGALGRSPPRLKPIPACLLHITSGGVVMAESLGHGRDGLGKLLLQAPRDTSMQLLPLTAQQTLVRGVLEEGMFEGVLGFRRGTAAEDQLGAGERLPATNGCRRCESWSSSRFG